MIRGFLLDIDGTLLDSNQAHAEAWSHAFKQFDYTVTPGEVLTLVGMGGDRVIPALVPELDPEHGIGKELSDYRKKYFLEHVVSTLHPTPGARDLLVALKEREIKLVVATSASSEEFKELLKQAKIDDLVHEYTTASDKESKPAPDIITSALKKIELPAEEVLMLGDTPYDIASAKKNGIETIAVRTGYFSDKQLQGSLHIYDDPKDVLEHLNVVLQ